MFEPSVGAYFLCEGDVWTVVHPTWEKTVIAENALGFQRSFTHKNGRWEVLGPGYEPSC